MIDLFLKRYNSKIYTYPLVYRHILSKYYATNDAGEVFTSENLKTVLYRLIRVFDKFDLRGKSVLEVGGNLASYLYFVECGSIDSVDIDVGITLTNNAIKEKLKRRCDNIQFYTTIPDKTYDYCFILSALYKDGELYTLDDYYDIFRRSGTTVVMDNEDNSTIFKNKERSVIDTKHHRLYVFNEP